jgi:hypothetical protein
MTNNSYPNVKALISNVLSKCSGFNLKTSRKNFIFTVLFCFSVVKGKINFLQLARFSGKCEQYFRINFENRFDFLRFNLSMIKERCKECIVAFDPSYIKKSGKNTPGLGRYWSGCVGKAKWGLDICGFAAVDINRHTAFHLNAIQTFKEECETLLEYYCRIVKEHYLYFKELSKYLVADSYFAKAEVVETVLSLGMHFISRLRDDQKLMYPYREPEAQAGKKKGKGRRKKYAGKVKASNPNMDWFKLVHDSKELKVYNTHLFCEAMNRRLINVSLVVFYKNGKETARKLYFSTDLTLDGMKIFTWYSSRFQIEFIYRDAKQHCGLEDCQARSKNKLDFHFNAALTTVNLAKIHWLVTKKSDEESFSMADFKTLCHNTLILNRFFRMFAINPNTPKNQRKINELRQFGLIAG